MPTPKDWLQEPFINKWDMAYNHYPPKNGSMFSPKVAFFKDQKTVYYISPFRVLVFEKITMKGVPLNDNFYYRQVWEYDAQAIGEVKSLQDVQMTLKMHFTLVIVKKLWGVDSILTNQSESSCYATVANHIKDKLQATLLAAQTEDYKKVKKL